MLLIGDLRMLAHLMALLHRYKESSTVIFRKQPFFENLCVISTFAFQLRKEY